MSKTKKFSVLTYGCQMNNYDSEKIAGILKNTMKFNKTDDLHQADIILLNTCSVREKAEQKVFSQLGRLKNLKKKNPDVIIGVCGCIAQLHGESLAKKVPYIDLVLGTHNIGKLPHLLFEIMEKRQRLVATQEDTGDEFSENFTKDIQRDSTVLAFVSIMKGCSNFCTYCVVPLTRGREKSRCSKHIIDEITSLGESGFKEVTLLGQNVNSYGSDLPKEFDFPDLLGKINDIKGIERIRFVTSHPKDLSEKLMYAMANLKKVCEHIHLPIQSGSDRILKAMNRKYTSNDYLKKIEKLQKLIPGVHFSTDIIVGFPGETDEDFNQTENIVKSVGFELIYLFKYSKRPETKASTLKGEVSPYVVGNRFDTIFSMQREIMLKNNIKMENSIQQVLIEGTSKKDKNDLSGRTRTNKTVNMQNSSQNLLGAAVDVLITKGSVYHLKGKLAGTHRV